MESLSLEKIWKDLCGRIEIIDPICEKWWKRIDCLYSTEGRYYHNLGHLRNFFSFYFKYTERIKEGNIFEMAIFFHDIIYDPKTVKKDNEINSALEFEVFYKESGMNNEYFLKRVKEMILATKNHSKSALEYEERKDTDVLMFLDLDLSILAESKDLYEEYAKNIRKEYSEKKLEEYREGRGKFLEGMMKAKIFYFLTDLKKQALKNLEWEKKIFLEQILKE